MVRDRRAPELPGADVAVASYDDGAAVEAALQGIDTVLMVSAAEAPDRVSEHRSFIDAAARAGVGHLVYTSFVGASPTSTFTLGRDHWATEEHLRASGIPHTILRDNLYADFLAVDGRRGRRHPRAGRRPVGWPRWPATTSPTSRRPCCSPRRTTSARPTT